MSNLKTYPKDIRYWEKDEDIRQSIYATGILAQIIFNRLDISEIYEEIVNEAKDFTPWCPYGSNGGAQLANILDAKLEKHLHINISHVPFEIESVFMSKAFAEVKDLAEKKDKLKVR